MARLGSHADSLANHCMRTVFCGTALTGAEGRWNFPVRRVVTIPGGQLFPVVMIAPFTPSPLGQVHYINLPFLKDHYTLEACRSFKKL